MTNIAFPETYIS